MAWTIDPQWDALRAPAMTRPQLIGGARGRCIACHGIYAKRDRNDVHCVACEARRSDDALRAPEPARYITGIGMVPYETEDRWLMRNLLRVEADNVRMERDGASGFPPQVVR